MQGTETSRALDMDMGEQQPYLKQETDSPVEEDTEHGIEHLANRAQQEVGKIADEARQQVMTQLTHQKDRAAATLSNVGAAIREAGKDPRQLGQTPVAPFTAQAAEQVEKVSIYLRRRDITALRLEVEQFARTRAPLFVACALTTGWLGARFLKSRIPVETQQSATYVAGMPYTGALTGPR
jgi:hypothetical protein